MPVIASDASKTHLAGNRNGIQRQYPRAADGRKLEAGTKRKRLRGNVHDATNRGKLQRLHRFPFKFAGQAK